MIRYVILVDFERSVIDMTHSKVFTDGYFYVVLVAHTEGWNEVIDGDDGGMLSGLLEYAVPVHGGELALTDLDDGSVYSPDATWTGLDKEAIGALLEAAGSRNAAGIKGGEYGEIISRYEDDTENPELALRAKRASDYAWGTIIRLDYGGVEDFEVDIAVKRDDNFWEITGSTIPWDDAEVDSHDYEVIYNV